MRRLAVLAAVAALTLAACGGDDQPASSGASGGSSSSSSNSKSSGAYGGGSSSSASGGGATLKIAADPDGAKKFTKSKLTAKAGKVTLKFSNQSQLPHAVVISGNGVNESTQTVTGGDAPPVTVDLK